MNEINQLRKDLTIIMIAHRLSTLKNCDKIYVLENSKIITQGTFENLVNDSDHFQEFAKSTKKNQ